MLFLIVSLIFGVLLFSRNLRLESASDAQTNVEEKKPAVRAYVDGKPVKSYLKE